MTLWATQSIVLMDFCVSGHDGVLYNAARKVYALRKYALASALSLLDEIKLAFWTKALTICLILFVFVKSNVRAQILNTLLGLEVWDELCAGGCVHHDSCRCGGCGCHYRF